MQDKAIQIIEESINQKTKTQIYSDLYVRLTCALYANGKGVERSIETAREWWMKSAKHKKTRMPLDHSNNLTKLKEEQHPRSHHSNDENLYVGIFIFVTVLILLLRTPVSDADTTKEPSISNLFQN